MIEIKIIATLVLYAWLTLLWCGHFDGKAISNDWSEVKALFIILLPLWLPAVLVLLFL